MSGAMPGRQVFPDLLIEGEQSYGISLQVQKIRQGGCQRGCVLRFGVSGRAVAHRAAVINHQVTTEVGFILEFLDEVTVTASKNPPIDITRIVSRGVLAILGELY